MRKIQRTLPLVLILFAATACFAAGDAPQPADQVLTAAEASARAENKNVWVIFGASWCVWCRHLDALIDSPDAGPVLSRYFVVAHLTVLEHGDKASLDSPGGDAVMRRLGGGAAGLPFFAFVDASGQVLANSNRPVAGKAASNIGFPSAPEEVDWFMTMLHRAAPLLSAAEARTIETKLRAKTDR
jgi:thiol-disulfide isomerase/thioredoxin